LRIGYSSFALAGAAGARVGRSLTWRKSRDGAFGQSSVPLARKATKKPRTMPGPLSY
jgi:hypothetical protein